MQIFPLDLCTIQFLTQPPVDLPCNPYDETRNYLQLQCDISIPRDRRNNITVAWYRIQAGETEPESVFGRGPGKRGIKVLRRLSTGNLTLLRSSLQLQNITEEDMGIYWCQIEDNEGEEPVIHRPCTVTNLTDPDSYDHLTRCPDFTNFFSLGPVCVEPQTECSTSSMSLPTSSPEPSSPTTITTTPVINDTTKNTVISEWFIFIIVSAVLLLVLLILGVLTTLMIVLLKARRRMNKGVAKTNSTSAWCLRSHEHQNQDSSSPLPVTPVVHVQVPKLASMPAEVIPMPRHLNIGRQQSNESVYAEPDCPVRYLHDTETNLSETGSLYSNPHFDQEASEELPRVERDGNFYQIIAKSPIATERDNKLVNYTVPKIVKQRTDTGNSSVVVTIDDGDAGQEEPTYENPPQPQYARLRADTQDLPRIYTVPSDTN